MGALAYEAKEANEFKQAFRNDDLKKLKTVLATNEVLAKERKFLELDTLTTLLNPIYNGKTFFDVLNLTNLLEGDLIRIYAQILDRLGQIRKASTNSKLLNKVANCQGIIERALEGIYLIG